MAYSDPEDQKAYARQHYLENKAAYKRRAVESKRTSRRRNAQYVHEYLLAHPCADCGETDPVVLQFDHRDGADKSRNISDMVNAGHSLAHIDAEIAKCDVRCANDHARRTAASFGWFSFLATQV